MKKHVIGASIAALVASTVAASAQELNVLTWEGYSDDSFIAAFVESDLLVMRPEIALQPGQTVLRHWSPEREQVQLPRSANR